MQKILALDKVYAKLQEGFSNFQLIVDWHFECMKMEKLSTTLNNPNHMQNCLQLIERTSIMHKEFG
jgi:hypothetical protein